MKVRACKLTAATIAVVSFAASVAVAGIFGHHHSSPKSAEVDIAQTTKIPSGPTLQPGTYKAILVEDSSTPEVEFYQEGKMRTVLSRFRTWWYLNFVYPKIVAMRIRQLS